MRELSGTLIGPYKLLEQIGEGSVAFVFGADQLEPVRRKVAIKFLRPEARTRENIARFEAERQCLALMDHGNIVRIHDGGSMADGCPYFVMELIHGLPITDYCDRQSLTVARRLELTVQLCRATQHAHQKGIIYRDWKPADVLVRTDIPTPVVKLIDFGRAKAMGQRLTDKTLFTGPVQMIGTPAYMSPEQTGLAGMDVDTRSDIYSLGALLYELLTGTTPLDHPRLHAGDEDDVRRIVQNEQPPKPSTRLARAQDLAELARKRREAPSALVTLVQGELDGIVMKCLEKDRDRRYQTARELADDIQEGLRRQNSLSNRLGRMARGWFNGTSSGPSQ